MGIINFKKQMKYKNDNTKEVIQIFQMDSLNNGTILNESTCCSFDQSNSHNQGEWLNESEYHQMVQKGYIEKLRQRKIEREKKAEQDLNDRIQANSISKSLR